MRPLEPPALEKAGVCCVTSQEVRAGALGAAVVKLVDVSIGFICTSTSM